MLGRACEDGSPSAGTGSPRVAPNDFASTAEVARALNQFERRYNEIAEPFEWKFTREKLAELLDRIERRQPPATDDQTGLDLPALAAAA